LNESLSLISWKFAEPRRQRVPAVSWEGPRPWREIRIIGTEPIIRLIIDRVNTELVVDGVCDIRS